MQLNQNIHKKTSEIIQHNLCVKADVGSKAIRCQCIRVALMRKNERSWIVSLLLKVDGRPLGTEDGMVQVVKYGVFRGRVVAVIKIIDLLFRSD